MAKKAEENVNDDNDGQNKRKLFCFYLFISS